MRVNSSLVLAVSVLLLNSSGRVGFAQAPGGVGAPARVQIGSPSVPSVYQLRQAGVLGTSAVAQPVGPPQFNSMVPQHNRSSFDNVAQSNVPATMLPSPDMSPFNLSYDQHVNENGLWMNDSNRRGKKYFLTAEYLRTKTRRPTGLVGNPLAATYLNTVDVNAAATGIFDLQTIGDVISLELGEAQLVASAQGQLSPTETVGFPPLVGNPGFNFFDRQSLSVFGDVNSHGARIRGGWWNPDNSAVVVTAWWSSQQTDQFNAASTLARGRGSRADLNLALIESFQLTGGSLGGLLDVDLGDSLTGFDLNEGNGGTILAQNLLNLRGLPLDDGTLRTFNDGTFIGGVTAPFDLEYRIDFTVEAGGGSVNWMMSPIRRFGKLQLRPVMGLRYMFIREEFGFVGRDSGLSYNGQAAGAAPFPDIKIHSLPNFEDDDGDGIIDNAAIAESQGQANVAVFEPIRVATFPELFPLTSFLDNKAQSHLAGPEVGFHYDMSGRRFNLWGQTKVALLANHERLRMDGDNIGMSTRPGNFFTPNAQNPFPNTFGKSETHSHVSPLIETSIVFEMDIFAYLPLFNRIQLLKEATFSTGYTYTWVGEVVAPEESIVWRGNPRQDIFPLIDIERKQWTVSSFNFGVHWEF